MSSLVDSDHHSNFERSFIRRILEDATRWSYGTIGSEVWIFNGVHLVRPDNAISVDPQRRIEEGGTGDLRSSFMRRLAEEDHEDYIIPDPLPPGVGFPGILFQEASRSSTRTAKDGGPLNLTINNSDPEAPSTKQKRRKKGLAWRKVRSIVQDPDQQITQRMDAIASAGVGYVCGIPFSIGGTSGIVMYWAREDVDLERLQTAENEQYLVAAAHLVGSAWAVRGPRQTQIEKQDQKREDTFGRVRRKMHTVLESSSLEELASTPSKLMDRSSSTLSTSASSASSNSIGTKSCHYAQEKMQQQVIKSRGAGMCVPPPASTQESVYTFVGVFVTIIALGGLNEHFTKTYGSDYSIVMGPFGALMTLQFALTSAPAAQPRSAMLGQLIALPVSIGVSYIDSGVVPVYVKQAMATALTIMLMARLATVHPPAGASALLFASGSYTWSHMLTMLVANVVAIGMSVLINNFNSLRQYPTYWGIGATRDILCPKAKPTDERD